MPSTRPGTTNELGIADPVRQKRPYRLSEAGRARLRAAALRNEPWRHSTGPRTPEGKRRCSQNAWKHGERAALWLVWSTLARAWLRTDRDLHGGWSARHARRRRHLIADAPALLRELATLAAHLPEPDRWPTIPDDERG
ncbi:MAG: hypothetical protein ACTS3F_02650 [Phycisphaerales bacterium]